MHHIHFKTILIPVDFTELDQVSMKHALWLSKKFYSEITLVHVRESLPYVTVFPSLQEPHTELFTKYDELALEKLTELAEVYMSHGIKNVKVQLLNGSIAKSIKDYVESEKIDLVLMSTHGSKGGFSQYFLGSNAFKVVNMIDSATLTINQSNEFHEYQNIVVPIDDTPYSRAKVPYALEMAAILGSKLHLVYPEVKDEYRTHTIQNHLEQVCDLLKVKEIPFTTKKLTDGSFAHEILKYAEYTNADLIIIMSETELTISSMLLGSQAQEIVNHSLVPVITLHPEDKGEMMNIFS